MHNKIVFPSIIYVFDMALLKWYKYVLKTHPWKTQMLTTGILMGSGDVISQTLLEKRKLSQIEPLKAVRFGCLGIFLVAPALRIWYLQLEKIFGVTGATVGLKKMLTDQLVFAPSFLGCFLVVSEFVQLKPWNSIKEKLHQDYLTVLRTNYLLWPAAQLVTFYYIPMEYRIVFVSFVSLIWNTYLASKANRN